MHRLQDKVAIVTGGGKGIGKACAMHLAENGAKVVITQRNEEEGRQVVREIEEKNGRAIFVRQDVSKEEDWENVLKQTRAAFGPPDILVNNAGMYIIEPAASTSLDQWRTLMEVNAMGVFLGIKHCAPVMAENGGGSIINMSSVAALIGSPNHILYSASKGAVLAMTRVAAMEFADSKVRVNSVHPGYTDTEMADYGAEKLDTSKEGLGRMYPLGRIGKPEDVACGVLYLASDDAAYVTGTQLLIDGGYTAH